MSQMSALKAIVKTGLHQVENLSRVARGLPLTTASLASMTLDWDDVELAFKSLEDRSGWTDGSVVSAYEDAFARWNGSRFAYAFMGGRVSLSACISALGLTAGDEVIIPGYTCVVVPNAFEYEGITPVYCDIELDTYGPDLADLRRKLSDRTRAVMLHHLYGLVCRDYDEICDFAESHGLHVIEDCAHATGAEHRGRKVGTRGIVSFYSSEQSKIFNTILGGIAVTDDPDIAAKLEAYYRACPSPSARQIEHLLMNVALSYYELKDPNRWWRGDLANIRYGRNRVISTTMEEQAGIRPASYAQRMPAPIAALGLNQLRKIDAYNETRRATAERWAEWCDAHACPKPYVVPGSNPVFLRYPTLVPPAKKRDTRWALRDPGVTLGVWYLTHTHPAPRPVAGCPNADRAVAGCVNFPSILA